MTKLSLCSAESYSSIGGVCWASARVVLVGRHWLLPAVHTDQHLAQGDDLSLLDFVAGRSGGLR